MTGVSYGALYGVSQDRCFWVKGIAECFKNPEVRRMTLVAVKVACTLDVVTDLLIEFLLRLQGSSSGQSRS